MGVRALIQGLDTNKVGGRAAQNLCVCVCVGGVGEVAHLPWWGVLGDWILWVREREKERA